MINTFIGTPEKIKTRVQDFPLLSPQAKDQAMKLLETAKSPRQYKLVVDTGGDKLKTSLSIIGEVVSHIIF